MLRSCQVWVSAGISFSSVVSDLESLGEWFHFVLFLVFQPLPSICFPSEHVNFYFIFFPHFSQDNAWDYDPATQVWGCRDSGGCSYYCHWGGSGKSPHLSGNASSDSTNTSTLPLSLSSHPVLRRHCQITGMVALTQRAQGNHSSRT